VDEMAMEIEAVIMALRHLDMVEIVGEIMVMVAIQGVDIVIITEALLKDHMVIGIVIEEIADQEDLLGNEGAHHTMAVEVIGIEIEREEDHEVVVLIIEEEEDIDLILESIVWANNPESISCKLSNKQHL